MQGIDFQAMDLLLALNVFLALGLATMEVHGYRGAKVWFSLSVLCIAVWSWFRLPLFGIPDSYLIFARTSAIIASVAFGWVLWGFAEKRKEDYLEENRRSEETLQTLKALKRPDHSNRINALKYRAQSIIAKIESCTSGVPPNYLESLQNTYSYAGAHPELDIVNRIAEIKKDIGEYRTEHQKLFLSIIGNVAKKTQFPDVYGENALTHTANQLKRHLELLDLELEA